MSSFNTVCISTKNSAANHTKAVQDKTHSISHYYSLVLLKIARNQSKNEEKMIAIKATLVFLYQPGHFFLWSARMQRG